jgi:hypothetical protein
MSLLLANFPPLTGRYPVGCHDIEWLNNEKQPMHPLSPNNAKDAQSLQSEEYCQSVLMRLYYPAKIRRADHKANWITHPEYAKGM